MPTPWSSARGCVPSSGESLAGQLDPQITHIDKDNAHRIPAPNHREAQHLRVERLQPREVAGVDGDVMCVHSVSLSLTLQDLLSIACKHLLACGSIVLPILCISFLRS